MKPAPLLTVYYDGSCPICATEMRRLMALNGARQLAFADISRPGFDPSKLGVDMAALNRELHAQTRDGALLRGIDSIVAAYSLVGLGWVVAPLRVRALRPALVSGYHWFARHRHRISALLGYRLPGECDGTTCGLRRSRTS